MPYRSPRPALFLRTILLALILLPGLLAGHAIGAQESAGEAFPVNVISGNGLDISVIGMEAATVDAAGTHLTLERVTVQPDTIVEPQGSATPALVVLQRGSVLAVDERGFISRIDAPSQLLMPAGSAASWTASEDVTFLRLSLTEKPPAPSAGAGVGTEVLASLVMSQPPAGETQLFIATATLAPDMASVRVDHTGTTGLFVETGTVEVLSPSGLEGQLQQGASIIFPQSAPLNLLGTAGTDATAILFGITDAPDAASVVISTIVDACRNTGQECTAHGTALANGETWLHPDASLTLNATTAGTATWVTDSSLSVELTYENKGDGPVEFSVTPETISIAYDDGQTWTPESDADHTFSLQPGESDTMTLTFAPPGGAGEGNVMIRVSDFGDISGAQWQGFVELLTITLPGTTLTFGDTWTSETATLEMNVRQATSDESNQPERDIALEITYTNVGTDSLGMTMAPNFFQVAYENGGRWTTLNSVATTMRVEPGESRTITFFFRGHAGRVGGDLRIEVEELGGITDATWQGPNPITQ